MIFPKQMFESQAVWAAQLKYYTCERKLKILFHERGIEPQTFSSKADMLPTELLLVIILEFPPEEIMLERALSKLVQEAVGNRGKNFFR